MEFDGCTDKEKKSLRKVLILIIMEDTHGVEWGPRLKDKWLRIVLILIIMEDTHGVKPNS